MDDDDKLDEVYVQPGESHLTTEPVILRTLLGSCVAVAFLAVFQGVGALCHPMLPRSPRKTAEQKLTGNPRRYVDYAIRELAQRFDTFGIPRERVMVKVFGGADVLQVPHRNNRPTVGHLNCEAALEVLREERFQIAASSLGGDRGLNLRFNTRTGEVQVRRLG